MPFNYTARAELYLGRDRQDALAQGPRQFRSAAQALHFAFHEAAPVSLHGASLVVDGRTYKGKNMKDLFRSPSNPFNQRSLRKAA